MPDLTDTELDELEALERAATPGPWMPCPMRVYIFGPNRAMVAFKDVAEDEGPFYLRGVGGKLPMGQNMDVITKGRNALPRLLAEVRRLRAELARRGGGE